MQNVSYGKKPHAPGNACRVQCSSPAASLLAVLTLAAGSALAQQEPIEPANPEQGSSRALVARFAGELQTALKTAMAEGGPKQAITVCKDIAPQIASQLSRESGAAVGRTSLKPRNPRNLPQAWQQRVLLDFDAAAASGRSAASLEYFSAADDNSGARYMKAIPTAGLCLACHGSTLSPDVRDLLATHYPYDRATGYSEGDIRGAFSVVWPPDKSGDTK